MRPYAHSSTIHNSQDMEPTLMSINRWMDKEDVIYIYNRILLSHKKEWNNAISSNMDATRDDHTKWSKSDRERQIPYDITYMWNLKYDTNEPIYEIETESQTYRADLWLPRGRPFGEGWGGGWGERMWAFIYGMDKQQGPAIEHRKLYSIFYDKP